MPALKLAFASALAVLCTGAARAQQPARPFAVQHYDETLRIEPADQTLAGTALITFVSLSDTLNAVYVFLSGRQMWVDSISMQGKALHYERIGDSIAIALGRAFAAGAAFQIAVGYNGTPTNEGGNTGLGGVFFGPAGFYTMSTGLVGNSISAARYWMPCYDLPDDKATFTLHITVPPQYTAVSAGALARVDSGGGEATYTWNETHPAATCQIGIAAAPYSYAPIDPADRVGMYSLGAGPAPGIAAQISAAAIPYFDSLYGALPFDKISFVQIAANHLAQQSLVEFDTVFAHPFFDKTQIARWLANEWWGALVTPQSAGEFWMQEALAAYSQALFVEHTQGEAAYARFLDSLHQYYFIDAQFEGALTLQNYKRLYPSSNFPATLSEKGAAVLAMLRRAAGDSAFFAALNNYARQNALGWMTTQTLEDAFARPLGGAAHAFFDAWVRDSGWPQLAIDWSRAQASDTADAVQLHVRQTQAQRGWRLFAMPITIRFISIGAQGAYDTTDVTLNLRAVAAQDTAYNIPGRVVSMQFNADRVALVEVQSLTAVREPAAAPPPRISVFPDPFRRATTIEYELKSPQNVSLGIVDETGGNVAALVHAPQGAGRYRIVFEASGLPAGVYFLQGDFGARRFIRKLTVRR